MNRRRRMMFGGRWASEPLIVYDGSANVKDTLAWQINLNNGYKDAKLTNKQWKKYSVYGELRFGKDGAELYLSDVTKYRKLCMTYQNINSTAEEGADKDFGVAKDENYGIPAKNLSADRGSYDVYKKLSGYGTGFSTVELNIENLEGKKMIGFDPKFGFTDDEANEGIIVHKIWLE